MSAHRYWRLLVTGAPIGYAGNYPLYISELVLSETQGGSSVASGGVATGNDGMSSPGSAFDGNNATSLFSIGGSHWVQYDFGAGNEKDIVEVGILIPSGQPVPTGFGLWFSDDEIFWEKRRVWFTTDMVAGTMSRFDMTLSEPSANRVISKITFEAKASLPQFPMPKIANRAPSLAAYKGLLYPRMSNHLMGGKRISGSTTVQGMPARRKVQLYEQKSGLLVAEQYTRGDGLYEFENVMDVPHTVVGVDPSGEQNSVIYAHVMPVQ